MRTFYLPPGLAAVLISAIILPGFALAQTIATPTPLPQPGLTSTAVPALTLAAAIQRALLANPDLRATSRELEIAEAGMQQAAARPNPELALLSEGLQKENRTTTVQLNQLLELGGKRTARMAAAGLDRSVAAADLAAHRVDIQASVINAYFDVLAAQQRLQLAQAMQRVAGQVSDSARKRVTAGKVSPLEETRARVAEAGTRMELAQASSELIVARARLAAFWGSSNADFGELAEPEKNPGAALSLAGWMAKLVTAPQVSRARVEITRQQALIDVERSRRIPDITLSLGSKRDEQAGRTQTVVGISLPIPVFDSNKGSLLSALRREDKARDELAATENRLALEMAAAYQRHAQANAELEILRADILPGAQSAFDAASRGFELGKFSSLDVLDAQRTLFQARSQHLRALAESHRALAELHRLAGTDQQN
ncbi:TolC family protein [Undibacterium terreum]|uniref:RND transporter n=1 Tax=Undibacterium terreum TaxID=1224302 RepID=A0A916XD16_9BURK|nr:TolC family protein [Undibacterium terreum]GGC62825.1 RND transporter [Undibacterium terreum]